MTRPSNRWVQRLSPTGLAARIHPPLLGWSGGSVVADLNSVRNREDLAVIAGTVVHQALGRLLVEGNRQSLAQDLSLIDQIYAVSKDIVAATPLPGSHRRRVAAQVNTAISCYWMRWLPDTQYQFVGSEIVIHPTSRVDLVWAEPEASVFFDEVKLGRQPLSISGCAALEQAQRYSRLGLQHFGARFVGVRLLPLQSPSEALFVHPSGKAEPLAESPLWEVR